jgi:hypothetical protein
MSSSISLGLFIALVVVAVAVLLFAQYKKNSHTELYKEGVRHENEGEYKKALQNFEDALSEIRKLNTDNKFGNKISDRIKILRTIIEYEKSFQAGRPL